MKNVNADLNGWVVVPRKIIGEYDNPVVSAVFIHLLIIARWDRGEWNGIPIERGQAVVGRRTLAKKLGYTENQIRTALKVLERDGYITTKTTHFITHNTTHFATHSCTLVTVNDYNGLQSFGEAVSPTLPPTTSPTRSPLLNERTNITNSKYNSILITEIVDYLNDKTDKKYRQTEATKRAIGTLLEQGYSADDMKKVIDKKSADWMGTKYEAGLAPKSLFAVDRFDDYLNEAPAAQIDISAVQGELIHLKIKKNEDHLTQDEVIRLKELEEIYDKYRQKA